MNSAAWHSRSRIALRRAEDAGTSAGLLMIDLDHFKAVNDRHGHLAGDDVLEVVAATLREQVRDHDLVGRFGGEEFVVLLPHLPDQAGDPDGTDGQDEVRRIGDRIRARVGELRIDVGDFDDADGGAGRTAVAGVTVSVGGAVFPRDGSDLTALMASADAALYAAKRSGRNAVRMGSDLTDSRPGGDAPVAG